MSREQYRALLPQGDRYAALEALRILLVSRPVVYLGFGLRDPDFMYLRDTVLNTFKGGTRDHYAVMADVSEAERDYWRRKYGIHIVGYTTKSGSDGRRDHTDLLALLDGLLEKAGDVTGDGFDPCGSDSVLALVARHAGRLMGGETLGNELQLRVQAERASPRDKVRREWLERVRPFPGGGIPGRRAGTEPADRSPRGRQELCGRSFGSKTGRRTQQSLSSGIIRARISGRACYCRPEDVSGQSHGAGRPSAPCGPAVRDVVAAFQGESLPRLVQRRCRSNIWRAGRPSRISRSLRLCSARRPS